VPSDNKWFTRIVVAAAIVDTLENLQLAYPEVAQAGSVQGHKLVCHRAEVEVVLPALLGLGP
jgi:hypothetical protein